MASFDAVNYMLRPNKAVERRIVFACLAELGRVMSFSNHQYIGLGSLWFVDFVMAHKLLRVNQMYSIEKSEIGQHRAEFNRPLDCITVLKGESTKVLSTFDWERAPAIVWLDYDSSIGGPVLTDIELVLTRALSGSVVLITINAKRDELPDKDEHGIELDPEDSLRRIAGDMVPTSVSAKDFRRNDYPKLLLQVIANQMNHIMSRSARTCRFIKLFELEYSDGTPMITYGGAILDEGIVPQVEQIASNTWQGISSEPITVPPLTLKEKLTFDRMLPAATAPSIDEVRKSGLYLKQSQINSYHRHYLHYPVFGEFQF